MRLVRGVFLFCAGLVVLASAAFAAPCHEEEQAATAPVARHEVTQTAAVEEIPATASAKSDGPCSHHAGMASCPLTALSGCAMEGYCLRSAAPDGGGVKEIIHGQQELAYLAGLSGAVPDRAVSSVAAPYPAWPQFFPSVDPRPPSA